MFNMFLALGVLCGVACAITPMLPFRFFRPVNIWRMPVIASIPAMLIAVVLVFVVGWFDARGNGSTHWQLRNILEGLLPTFLVYFVISLIGVSFGVVVQEVRRKVRDNLEHGHGFFDGTGRTAMERVTAVFALLVCIIGLALLGLFVFLVMQMD